jgi:hypothetical protein
VEAADGAVGGFGRLVDDVLRLGDRRAGHVVVDEADDEGGVEVAAEERDDGEVVDVGQRREAEPAHGDGDAL